MKTTRRREFLGGSVRIGGAPDAFGSPVLLTRIPASEFGFPAPG